MVELFEKVIVKGTNRDLGDLEEKTLRTAWSPKRFFVKPTEARTVTMESLIAVFPSLDKL